MKTTHIKSCLNGTKSAIMVKIENDEQTVAYFEISLYCDGVTEKTKCVIDEESAKEIYWDFKDEVFETEVEEAPKGFTRIFPCGTTEKSYVIEDGSNGAVTRFNHRQYHKYVAKSICKVINNEIYAPFWALK